MQTHLSSVSNSSLSHTHLSLIFIFLHHPKSLKINKYSYCAGGPPVVSLQTASTYRETSKAVIADEHKRTRGGFSDAASSQPALSQSDLARIPSPSSGQRPQQQQMPPPPPLFHSAVPLGKNLTSNITTQTIQHRMQQPSSS